MLSGSNDLRILPRNASNERLGRSANALGEVRLQPPFTTRVIRDKRRAISSQNAPSGAKCLDQSGHLLGLIVMDHMTRLFDQLFTPIRESLEARLVLIERD